MVEELRIGRATQPRLVLSSHNLSVCTFTNDIVVQRRHRTERIAGCLEGRKAILCTFGGIYS
jgi:hypothetical protein